MSFLVDRAHWLAAGFTVEDAAYKASLVRKNLIAITLVVAGSAAAASRLVDLDTTTPIPGSRARCAAAALNAAVLLTAWYFDAVRSPPAEEGNPAKAVTRTIGPWAYFTKQALGLQVRREGFCE